MIKIEPIKYEDIEDTTDTIYYLPTEELTVDLFRGGYVPGQDRRLPGRGFRPAAAHRRRVPDLAQGHQLADPRGLHRHRGRPHLPVPQGQRLRPGVDAVQRLRRRPVPGRLLYGD